MRLHWVLALLLTACKGGYDDGWETGCDDALDRGSDDGLEDLADCQLTEDDEDDNRRPVADCAFPCNQQWSLGYNAGASTCYPRGVTEGREAAQAACDGDSG